jgi:hypothetical protein
MVRGATSVALTADNLNPYEWGVPMPAKVTILIGFMLVLLPAARTSAQPASSPQVAEYLVQANLAGEWLDQGDLARMEAALEPGFNEIIEMMESYHPDARTNTYLRKRGWGQLVWTQMMYRLLAIRGGLFDREMEFAEKVALESVAEAALQTVELSFSRIQALMGAMEKMSLDKEIDQFAAGLFEGGNAGSDYRSLVCAFRTRFVLRQSAVMARIATERHPGIIDPGELPMGTAVAQAYLKHVERMKSESRLDEILNSLAESDPNPIRELADVAQNSPSAADRAAAGNEAKLRLLVTESSLNASEHDAEMADMLEYFERVGYLAYEPGGAYTDDVRSVMVLVYAAKRKLAAQTQPEKIRELYAIADMVK